MSYTQAFFFWAGFALVSVVSFIIAMYTSLDLQDTYTLGVWMFASIVTALVFAPFALKEENKKNK